MSAATVRTEPFAVVPLWVMDRATPEALKLYLVLYATGTFRDVHKTVSQASLARSCGVSVRSVQRYIEELKDLGALTWEHQQGSRAPSVYVLSHDAPVSPKRLTTQVAPEASHTTTVSSSHDTGGSTARALLGVSIVEAPEVTLAPTSSTRPRDLVWDFLVEQYGEPAHRGKRNASVKTLKNQDATPEDMAWMIENLVGTEKDWAIVTPEAMASHFGERFALASMVKARGVDGQVARIERHLAEKGVVG